MDARSQLLTGKSQPIRTTAAVAAMAAFPTAPPPAAGDATCGALTGMRSGAMAPRSLKVSMRAAAAATLSDAFYVGYNVLNTIWEELGRVRDGNPVTLSATRGFAQILRDVPACYTHLSIVGTLSASTLTAEAEPIEGDE
jgi:hypothetical protein